MRSPVAAGLFASLLLVIAGVAQAPGPTLRITEPKEYAVGPLVIRVVLDPPSTPLDKMTFFADGILVCTVELPPWECPWNAGQNIAPHTFRVVAHVKGGKRVPDTVTTKPMKFVDNYEVPGKHITVMVLDGSNYVSGLKQEAFRVYDDDVRKPITFFSKNTELQMVLAVDVSDSMVNAIEEVKRNVKGFISALRETDRVTIVGFNEKAFIVAPASLDHAAQLKRIDRLGSWGMTSLYETLIWSFDFLGRQQGRRLAIVFFTDGEDTASRVPQEAAERRKETSDAVLYMIGQGQAIAASNLREICERLARKSGGRAFFPRDMNALREAFDEIVQELSNQYLVGFEPHTDAEYHRLRVEVDGNYKVRTTEGYRWRWKPGGSS